MIGLQLNFSVVEPCHLEANQAFFDALQSAREGTEFVLYRADCSQEFYDLVSIQGRVLPLPVFFQILGEREHDFLEDEDWGRSQLPDLVKSWGLTYVERLLSERKHRYHRFA